MTRRAVGFSVLVVLAWVLSVGPTHAQQASGTKAAQTSTEAWLSLIDNQHYAASWDASARSFRARVTQQQWQAAAQSAREPFGTIKSRTLKSATSTATLPGAPDGEYVVFTFNTRATSICGSRSAELAE